MQNIIRKIITTGGGILGVSLSVFFLTFVVLAWTGPQHTPPTCESGEVGCEEVLHTGTSAQSKEGGLLLNTGGATNGLIVENGNVGIGTTTPGGILDVAPASGNYIFGSGAVSEENPLLYLYGYRTGQGQRYGTMQVSTDGNFQINSQQQLEFFSGTTGYPVIFSQGSTEAMRIHTNGNVGIGTVAPESTLDVNGIVNIRNQPIISGQIGSAMTSPVAPQKIAFNDFWVSRGIVYDSVTRRFTVPVDGVYRITFNPFFKTGVTAGRVLIGINNDTPNTSNHRGHAYRGSADYETGSINSVVELNAGDYIVFYLSQGSLYNITTDRFNQFSIEKIS